MNVKAKHSGSMKGTLNLDFEYANSSGYYSVCDSEAQIQVDTSGQYKEYSKSCTGEIVGEVDHFYYNVRSSNNFDGDIITDGGTSVEVNAQ
jgi:hypothetical protein